MYGMDFFYISYDEPQKEEFWQRISQRIPHAQRVDNVTGFHKAHQTCAKLAKTDRFFTIDGDTLPNDFFWELQIPEDLIRSQHVLSWSSRNFLNGLSYGNGGIKSWPRDLLLHTKTHEESVDERSAVDFCFSLSYFLMTEELSTTFVTQTPLQAFRAGFREGIKMSLPGGKKIESLPLAEHLHQRIYLYNIERLRIWCSVGSDVTNGLWAILGARKGLSYLYLENRDFSLIRDYNWFNDYWHTHILSEIHESNLVDKILELGESIDKNLKLNLTLFSKKDSQFFKSVYVNRPRTAQILRWD